MSEEGYLASVQIASPTFTMHDAVPYDLRELWSMLTDGRNREALAESRRLRRVDEYAPDDEKAALLAASAAAELRAGEPEEVIKLAKQSFALVADQWMAHAARIAAYEAMQQADRAFRYAISVRLGSTCPAWDQPVDAADLQVLLASLAWKIEAWDDVTTYLRRAYPAGVASMPEGLREDWFRLAFYRDDPEEAAAAARAICPSCTVDQLDSLLHAMVRQGWTAQALPLYRSAFARHSASQLLRRRLVGLCIRTGEVEEARRLTSTGALNIIG